MNPFPFRQCAADRDLARRDEALPCLADLLDDDRLSAVLGEEVHVTRVRYKPGTSVLVAFRRTRNGRPDYGWALTVAAEGNGKLRSREQHSRSRGGAVRLLGPCPDRPEALVGTGGFEEDHALRRNLGWLGRHGLDRPGRPGSPQNGLLTGPTAVLRYKPERRIVVLVPSGVIKIAAEPIDYPQRRWIWDQFHRHGVPVLPELGGPGHARHGITAAPVWGSGDLVAVGGNPAAGQAGQGLAALHAMDTARGGDSARKAGKDAIGQIVATRAMIGALVPELEEPAGRLAGALLTLLNEEDRSRKRVWIHGDFSADQVLVKGTAVRLIDFDRMGMGEPEADLGAFAAVEEIAGAPAAGGAAGGAKTEGLLWGYRQAGGQVDPARMCVWAAVRLFTGSVDPFRDRAPDWAAETCWHIKRAGELIP